MDSIGSDSMVVETELISAAGEILKRLGFHDFVIRINHRSILDGILSAENIPNEKRIDALVTLDKLDKIGPKGVEEEFIERGIDRISATRILNLFTELEKELNSLPEYANAATLGRLTAFIGEHDSANEGTESLARVINLNSSPHIRIDPSLARGLSYYTGTIMEINVPDLAGSLGGGGRYDGLIGMFGKEQIPACGFSLGLERILVVMEERGMFPPEIADSTAADVLVTIWDDEAVADSLKLANELRSQGIRVTLYPEADKLGKQLKYADSIKVPYVCIVGPEESEKGIVKLKNLASGEEKLLSTAEIAANIGKRLA